MRLALGALALAVGLVGQPVLAVEDGSAAGGPTPWDYRTLFVVWDDAAQEWRADWTEGPSTVGLEAILDNEGLRGWELVTIVNERLVVTQVGAPTQEATRLRLVFKQPLQPSATPDGPDATPQAVEPAAEEEAAVSITLFAFAPDELQVLPGTTVTWTNEDQAQHTATGSDGTFDSGVLPQGAAFSHTFTQAGTFAYACAIHPGMQGTIRVR